MNWKIIFSRDANDFLQENRAFSEVAAVELVKRAIKMFTGERINVNIKKLKGEWTGFHRIKKGKIRVIVLFDFDNFSVFIERIDWRGNAYK